MKAGFIRLTDLHTRLIELANDLVAANVSPRLKDLRAHHQKKTKELHQAALFARTIQAAFGVAPENMFVGQPEDEYCAFDVILLWKKDDNVERLNVQLKELPPVRLGSTTSIEKIVTTAINKLGNASDIVLAIFVNRPIGPYTVGVPNHGLGGVCIYGLTGEIPQQVFVIGYIGDTKIETTVPLEI